MDNYLRQPIQLAESVRRAIDEADSFKQECSELGRNVERVGTLLKQVARLAATPKFYEHPTKRIMEEARKTMEKTLTLVKKCKKSGVLKRVITITSGADFHKVNRLLDSTMEDLNWLLSISEPGSDFVIPPIAATDPNLALVWQQIASIQSGSSEERAEAANYLASLAKDSERNGKIIIEEGGLGPLMKLLMEGPPAAQESAAKTLGELARDEQRAQEIVKAGAIQTFIHVLADAPVKVQTQTARALAAVVSHFTDAAREFGSVGAIRHLVALINDTIEEHAKTNIHAVVKTQMAQKAKQDEKQDIYKVLKAGYHGPKPSSHKRNFSSENGKYYYGPSVREQGRRERENEDPETIAELRAEVLVALRMLAANNLANCKLITDTRALLCFGKLMEKNGDVQRNAVMAVAEIAAVAESQSSLRWAAFKNSSPAVRAVVDQLLKVIKIDEPEMQVPALKAMGCLAKIFPAKDTHIVKAITEQLGKDPVVAAEAAVALQKFTMGQNWNAKTHCVSVLEANGITHLVHLTMFAESPPPVILLCNLVEQVKDHEALKSRDILTALQAASRNPQLAQNEQLREMLPKAIEHLELFQAGLTTGHQNYEYYDDE